MDMSTGGRICRQCGALITEDFGFCPACGCEYERPKVSEVGSGNIRGTSQAQAETPGQTQDSGGYRVDPNEYARYMQDFQKRVLENAHATGMVMLLIWVIIAFALGTFSFLVPDSMLKSYSSSTGLGEQLIFEGVIFYVSGALCLVSLIYMKKRSKWKLSFCCCIVSAISAGAFIAVGDTVCIYLVICGLLTSMRIRAVRSLFKD